MANTQTKKPADSNPDASGADDATGADAPKSQPPAANSTPPAAATPPADPKAQAEAQRLAQKKADLDAKREAARENEITSLKADLAAAEKHAKELEKENATLKISLEHAEREKNTYRQRLQDQKIGSLDLEPGQGQLKDSVTILNTEKMRIDARAGDVLVVGDKKAADKVRKTIGKDYRVHSVTQATVNELVEADLINIRK